MTNSTVPITGTGIRTDLKERAIRRRRVARSVLYLVLTGVSVLWLVPFAATVLTAVRTFDDIVANGVFAWPESVTLQNFSEAWTSGRLGRFFYSSMVVTVPAVAITLILSSTAAFVLARREIPGAKALMLVFLAGNLLPPQMLLIPVFELSNDWGIYDSYIALIAIHSAFQLGFGVFVMYNFMREIPGEAVEAAILDGATPLNLYRHVYVPLTRPAFAALATLYFTWIFNDYLWSIVLIRDTDKLPITAGLTSLRGEYITAWNVVAAGALLAAIPTMLIFFLLQRHFVKGLAMGSVD